MIPFQFLALAVGTVFIRILHLVRRRLGWRKYFSFADFLVEERHVTARGFLYMVLAPLAGGFLMGLVPAIHPVTVAAAGFLSAFIGVWPVFQFPDLILDEYLLPYWKKLRFLYVIFLGFSTSLAYAGFVAAHAFVPIVVDVTGTRAWQQFLDNLAANAIYDAVKAVVVSVLIGSGIYVARERKRIGTAVEKKKLDDWEEELRDRQRELP